MASHASIDERIEALFAVAVAHEARRGGDHDFDASPAAVDPARAKLARRGVAAQVGWLMETCQVPHEKHVVEDDEVWPAQTYRAARPGELARAALRSKELTDQFGEQVADARELDLEQFAAVLRSNAVCAWNECYAKRK